MDLMSKETKHNRRSFLGTTAVSIITAGIAIVGTAQASFNRDDPAPLPFVEETLLQTTFRYPTVMDIHTPSTIVASTQSAKDIRGASPLIEIDNEAPPKLIVDPPLPEPLSQGRVFIQYRTENLRVLPVFGKGALKVSPRIGHIHITVDDAPWHFVDASGETIILVGLKPGSHKVLIELADPTHKVIASRTVTFMLPNPK
jgi:Family of unknown function (DUF6130)